MEPSGKETIAIMHIKLSVCVCGRALHQSTYLFVIQVSNIWWHARLELYKCRLL